MHLPMPRDLKADQEMLREVLALAQNRDIQRAAAIAEAGTRGRLRAPAAAQRGGDAPGAGGQVRGGAAAARARRHAGAGRMSERAMRWPCACSASTGRPKRCLTIDELLEAASRAGIRARQQGQCADRPGPSRPRAREPPACPGAGARQYQRPWPRWPRSPPTAASHDEARSWAQQVAGARSGFPGCGAQPGGRRAGRRRGSTDPRRCYASCWRMVGCRPRQGARQRPAGRCARCRRPLCGGVRGLHHLQCGASRRFTADSLRDEPATYTRQLTATILNTPARTVERQSRGAARCRCQRARLSAGLPALGHDAARGGARRSPARGQPRGARAAHRRRAAVHARTWRPRPR